MSNKPELGAHVLRRQPPAEAWKRVCVRPVRTLDDLHKAFAVRTLVYMGEQSCPFDEEFDGNDFVATHLIAEIDGRPVATLRMRWFAGFAKLERVCIVQSARGQSVVQVLVAHAFEIASRKGYRRMIAQIQTRLWRMWESVMDCQLRPGRAQFSFSDYHYTEIDIALPAHPLRLTRDSDPFHIIRPEGSWDEPGVLETSAGLQHHDTDVAA